MDIDGSYMNTTHLVMVLQIVYVSDVCLHESGLTHMHIYGHHHMSFNHSYGCYMTHVCVTPYDGFSHAHEFCNLFVCMCVCFVTFLWKDA